MGDLDVIVPTNDAFVGHNTFVWGSFEDIGYLEYAAGVLRQVGRPVEGSVFLDIGAHIGTASLWATSVVGFDEAIAVEADPRNFRLLAANVAINGLAARITAHHLAISSRQGEARIVADALNSGNSRVDPIAVASAEPSSTVPMTTLDALIASQLGPTDDIGLLWIDVQGHEYQVLSGAPSLLRRAVPLVMEYEPGLMTGGLDPLLELVACHYDVFCDIRASRARGNVAWRPISELASIRTPAGVDPQAWQTDVLLLKQATG